MNSRQAKALSLPDVMSRLGYQPVKSVKGGRELWYKSPFRTELDASFHTSYLGGKWIWNDFGDTGGTVIDFVMRHERFQNVSQALEFLDRMFQGHFFEKPAGVTGRVGEGQEALNFSFQQHHDDQAAEDAAQGEHASILILKRVEPLERSLPYVCSTRGIKPAHARLYLKDVVFENTEKKKAYYAAGFANRAGGYEIRNPFFKSSIGQKDVSFIAGVSHEKLFLFEGFMDFLSALRDIEEKGSAGLRKLLTSDGSAFAGDVVVLNSASFRRAALDILASGFYKFAGTFFDNDAAGEKLREDFAEVPVEVVHYNFLYEGFKDYNAALIDWRRMQPHPEIF